MCIYICIYMYHGQLGKRDGKGRTCLHHAALLDHGRCTQVLLMHGASADARDDMGETALEVAAHAPRAQAFEAIVRSKGLRMGGKTGFPGSGSDPEDAQSPRSASPPLANGPASPEPHRTEETAVSSLLHGILLGPVTTSVSRIKSAHGSEGASRHRRGLSWSGFTGRKPSVDKVAVASVAAVATVAAGGEGDGAKTMDVPLVSAHLLTQPHSTYDCVYVCECGFIFLCVCVFVCSCVDVVYPVMGIRWLMCRWCPRTVWLDFTARKCMK